MLNHISNVNTVILSLIAGIFTFLITSLGASLVLFFKRINQTILDVALSLSAGIMLSSSYFSLITPALNMTEKKDIFNLALGILGGSIFLIIFNKLSLIFTKKKLSKTDLLLTSITLHNIPEGLILGISFGSILYNKSTLIESIALTIAIALQNFPEGSAISLPLRREGYSRLKSFILGSLSAIVEPIFSVIGCILVIKIKVILPFLLVFAAGAMIHVISSEIIPEYNNNKRKALINFCALLGFVIMMILDTYFG